MHALMVNTLAVSRQPHQGRTQIVQYLGVFEALSVQICLFRKEIC